MSLPDIKDAGTLHSIVRFGWPWHGLVSAAGLIGTTGKSMTPPSVCESWLIDIGLPEPVLDPVVEAAEAADGRTWTNWAMIPSGRVYDTALGADTFLHIDEAGVPWRVALTLPIPSTITDTGFGLDYTLTRFGDLREDGLPAAVPHAGHVDAVCEDLGTYDGTSIRIDEIVIGFAPRTIPFDLREVRLLDVYKNGTRALLGVTLIDSVGSEYWRTYVSLVEIVISGIGGADGSGLVVTAVETMSQPSLCFYRREEFGYVTTIALLQGIQSTVPGGFVFSDHIAPGYTEFSTTGVVTFFDQGSFARPHDVMMRRATPDAYYSPTGEVVALSVEAGIEYHHAVVSASPITASGFSDASLPCAASASYGSVSVEGYVEYYIRLLKNGVTHDEIVDRRDQQFDQTLFVSILTNPPPDNTCRIVQADNVPFGTYDIEVVGDGIGGKLAGTNVTITQSFIGSTSAAFAGFPLAGIGLGAAYGMLSNICLDEYMTSHDEEMWAGGPRFGVIRSGHAAALYSVVGGIRTYGPVATPAGSESTGLSTDFYYSLNRKTEAGAFSASKITWV